MEDLGTDLVIIVVFKLVSIVFALSAVFTGLRALFFPTTFSHSFGLPITKILDDRDIAISTVHGTSYVSLMGVRQLGTGIILLVFAWSGKWAESALILMIIGVLVAGTDGFFLARAGKKREARFHAVPGALIALLAATFWIRFS